MSTLSNVTPRRGNFEPLCICFVVNAFSKENGFGAGSFDMGATPEMEQLFEDERPVRRVTLTNNYYIGKYEVTQALWKVVMGKNPSYYKGNELPVECVSWNDCQKIISKLNKLTGKSFRLPTEVEWEYAARGGNNSLGCKYSGSGELEKVAWYRDNGGFRTQTVGSKQPNELGIYDMTGNVWEWCEDKKGTYASFPQVDPGGDMDGKCRVSRGGSWSIGAKGCHLSYRYGFYPNSRHNDLGFRLALSDR